MPEPDQDSLLDAIDPAGGRPTDGRPTDGRPTDGRPTDGRPTDIRVAAMNLLACREHSLRELRQKLARRFHNDELLEAELLRLAEENLQSDERYAESFARQRAAGGYGPVRIRQEMREKGLSDGAVATAFEQAGMDWFALAEGAFRKKFGEPAQVELKERARRIRFMQYRGFHPDHYQHLV